jgi:hypothetical protein
MMTITQIQEILRDKVQKAQLSRAQEDNDWLSFHAQPVTNAVEATNYIIRYTDYIKGILNGRKAKVFFNLLKFPLPTTSLLTECVDELNVVFEAADRFEQLEFKKDELLADAQAYLKKVRYESKYLKNDLFFAGLAYPNSVTIIDLPVEQTTDRPEPYTYILQAGQLSALKLDRNGKVEYVGWYTDTKRSRLIWIDEISYRVYTINNEVYTLEIESFHKLGYCPAHYNWHDALGNTEDFRRNNALLPLLSDIDTYLSGLIFEKDVRLHASFPYLWKSKEICTYQENQAICNNGYLTKNGTTVKECPKCAERKMVGPGTVFTLPMGSEKMSTPVGFVTVPTDNLKYHQDRLAADRAAIFKAITGFDKSPDSKVAINQDQVRSQFESRRSKLLYWSENLEVTDKFVVETKMRLRYGSDFISYEKSYGRNFYLTTLEDAVKDYITAQNSLPQYLLGQKRKVIETLIARNNSSAKAKNAILSLIEPYVDVPMGSLQRGTLEYEIKANFWSYVERFEAENGDLLVFGQLKPFFEKIEIIKTTIYEYGRVTYEAQRESLRQSGQQKGVPVA